MRKLTATLQELKVGSTEAYPLPLLESKFGPWPMALYRGAAHRQEVC